MSTTQDKLTQALVNAGTKSINAIVDIGIRSLDSYMSTLTTPQKQQLKSQISSNIHQSLATGTPVQLQNIVEQTQLSQKQKKQLVQNLKKEIQIEQQKQTIKQQKDIIKQQQKIIDAQDKALQQ